MENYYQNLLLSLVDVKAFNDENATETGAIPEYADEVADLDAAFVDIEAAEVKQSVDSKGVTTSTKDLKRTMAETVIQYAHKPLALAKRAKDKNLVEQLSKEISYIMQASKVDAVTRSKIILKVLTDNPTVLTNIKPADLAKVALSIKNYDDAKIDPRKAREAKKNDGTDAMIDAFKRGVAAAENMYTYIYGYYQDTKPALVKKLADCLEIEKSGIRHTGILGFCEDATPGALTVLLAGVIMKIVELGFIATSNAYGLCGISKIVPGTYNVEFSKEGYVTQTMVIFIRRGRTVQVEVKMVKATV